MTNDEIQKALHNLKPNAEWTLTGDNYADLVWLSKDAKPTIEEITAEIALLPVKAAEAKAKAQVAKESAQAKLTALGLTLDDLKALGL